MRHRAPLWWICIFSFATNCLSLVCETYDQKCLTSESTTTKNSTCSSLQQCDHTPGTMPACYALFGQSKDGGLDVIMKGCIPQNDQHCASSSVCNGQRKNLRKMPSLYYCCCTKDRCNHDVVMFISEETEGKDCTLKDLKDSIRHLTFLIWVHLMTTMIILSLIVITLMVWKLISYKRRRKNSRNVKHLSQVVCDKGTRHYQNTSHWKKQDFQLITCLVRSTFGEIWQARLHGSNRVVRIRLSAGSDDVYVYDKHVMAKNTNVNTTRVV
ncbi:hypothetical protein ACROYT_G027066 [Oculina patagonica]